MNRRPFLALVPAGLVAACAGTLTASQLASDASDLAAGLAGAAADLKAGGTIPATRLAQIDSGLAAVQAAARQVVASTSSTAANLTMRFVGAVNAVVTLFAAIPLLPTPVPTILAAVSVLLPVLEAEAGISVPLAATHRMAAALVPTITPPEARVILRGAGAQ